MAFYRAVQSTIDRLADFPESGPLTGYNHPKIRGSRFVPIEGFEKPLVFYKPSEDTVQVLRVLHGLRDIGALLEREER